MTHSTGHIATARTGKSPHIVESYTPFTPLTKRRLPAGRPRSWYIMHNRRLKAMRITIALLDSGSYLPSQATNRVIRRTAEQIELRPPSDTTCRLVRQLLRYSRT